MGTTPRGWRLPEQSTEPPDVVGWLATGLGDADADVTATNNRILYGPAAQVPTTLPPGTIYLGY